VLDAHHEVLAVAHGVVDAADLLADGQFPRKFAEDREKDIRWCTACDNCIELLIGQKPVGCTTYDREYSLALKAIRDAEGALGAKRT